MSISTEITKLQTTKTNLRKAIQSKGIAVPMSTSIHNYANYINNIVTGNAGAVEGTKTVKGPLTGPSANYFNIYAEGNAEWRFKATFKLSSLAANRTLCNCSNGSKGWNIHILSNGRLYVERGDYAAGVTWTDWTFTTDTWYTVEIYGTKASGTISASVNGSSFVSKSTTTLWNSSGGLNKLLIIGNSDSNGNNYFTFKGEIIIKGTTHTAGTQNEAYQNTLHINIEDAAVGGTLNLVSGSFTVTSTQTVQAEADSVLNMTAFRGNSIDLSTYNMLNFSDPSSTYARNRDMILFAGDTITHYLPFLLDESENVVGNYTYTANIVYTPAETNNANDLVGITYTDYDTYEQEGNYFTYTGENTGIVAITITKNYTDDDGAQQSEVYDSFRIHII